MANLSIPTEHKQLLRRIAEMEQHQFQELHQAMSHVQLSMSVAKLPKAIAQEVPSLPSEEVDEIVSVALSLTRLQLTESLSTPTVILNVYESLAEDPEFSVWMGDGDNRKVLESRLKALLDLHAFREWLKAFDVLHDNERNFHTARVVTNVRPFFGDEPNELPLGWTVIHTLKLTFIENRKRSSFFVTLDNSDVQRLIEQLERAQVKAQTLKQNFVNPDIIQYTSESGEEL